MNLAHQWLRLVGNFEVPQQFQQVSRLGFVTAPMSLDRGSAKLCTMFFFPFPGLVRYLYIFGGSCPVREFSTSAVLTLQPSLAFSYIGIVTARHLSSGHETNFAACIRNRITELRSASFSTESTTYIPRAAVTLGIGPHSSLMPVFCSF